MTSCAPDRAGCDLPLLFEFSESDVFDKVWKLPAAELHSDKCLLIARLLGTLRVLAPKVEWNEGSLRCVPERCADPRWRVSKIYPVHDPNWILPYVEWSGSADPRDYDPDPEKGCLLLARSVLAATAEEAGCRLEDSVREYRSELKRVATELDRFNGALPYLISLQIAHRLETGDHRRSLHVATC